MAQITHGINAVLSIPSVYTFVETAMGALAARKTIIRQYLRPRWGDRVLDIGCGPGDVVRFLRPGVEYVGFDESPAYIRTARRRYGKRATFHCDRVRDKTLEDQASFDFVLAFGVLHHLDDPEALDLFKLAFQALRPGGRLFTLDGCYMEDQSPVARWLLDKDRGKNVRTREAYLGLAEEVFSEVSVIIRHDIFWVPYTSMILECRR